ncbi:Dimethylallyltranstransferase [Orbilia brochopaga]|nr:Dimethylallyltranstransferase [Drechslerella brochopaga]
MNTASYLMCLSVKEAFKIGGPECGSAYFDELQKSFIGQSYDMYWRDNLVCPSEDEYMDMVSNKTGGLFCLLAKLTAAMAQENKNLEIDHLARLVGQFYQIRDDLMNLTNTTYIDQKGFCEDLDEGKFSYLMIHGWNSQTPDGGKLQALFKERAKNKSIAREDKEQVLEILRRTGSFEYTQKKLDLLQQEIESELGRLEKVTGKENRGLRMLLQKLTAKPEK